MRSHFSYFCDIAMIIMGLVAAVLAIFNGEYNFAFVYAALSSIQGDLLRNRLRQEEK